MNAFLRASLLLVRCTAIVVLDIALALAINTGLLILNIVVSTPGHPGPGIGFVLLPLWIVAAAIGAIGGLLSTIAFCRGARWQRKAFAGVSSASLVPGALLFFLLPATSGWRTAVSWVCGALVLATAALLLRIASGPRTALTLSGVEGAEGAEGAE